MTAVKRKEWDSGVRDRETLDEYQDRVLAEMQRLDDACGDWEEHIPFEAAVSYFERGELFETYREHVDGCDYCKDMLAAMYPSDKARIEVDLAVAWAIEAFEGARHNQPESWLQRFKADFVKARSIRSLLFRVDSSIWSRSAK